MLRPKRNPQEHGGAYEIRIINTPPGGSRGYSQGLVGLVLPLLVFVLVRKLDIRRPLRSEIPSRLLERCSRAVSDTSCVQCIGQVAIDALATHSPQAASWWRQNAAMFSGELALGFLPRCEEVTN